MIFIRICYYLLAFHSDVCDVLVTQKRRPIIGNKLDARLCDDGPCTITIRFVVFFLSFVYGIYKICIFGFSFASFYSIPNCVGLRQLSIFPAILFPLPKTTNKPTSQLVGANGIAIADNRQFNRNEMNHFICTHKHTQKNWTFIGNTWTMRKLCNTKYWQNKLVTKFGEQEKRSFFHLSNSFYGIFSNHFDSLGYLMLMTWIVLNIKYAPLFGNVMFSKQLIINEIENGGRY